MKHSPSNSLLSFIQKRIINRHAGLGRIFDFNTEKLSGKVRVGDGQPIPAQDYNFLLIGNQDFVPYIMAMTVPEVTLRCLQEIEQHPTGAKYIFRLQAVSLVHK